MGEGSRSRMHRRLVVCACGDLGPRAAPAAAARDMHTTMPSPPLQRRGSHLGEAGAQLTLRVHISAARVLPDTAVSTCLDQNPRSLRGMCQTLLETSGVALFNRFFVWGGGDFSLRVGWYETMKCPV